MWERKRWEGERNDTAGRSVSSCTMVCTQKLCRPYFGLLLANIHFTRNSHTTYTLIYKNTPHRHSAMHICSIKTNHFARNVYLSSKLNVIFRCDFHLMAGEPCSIQMGSSVLYLTSPTDYGLSTLNNMQTAASNIPPSWRSNRTIYGARVSCHRYNTISETITILHRSPST